MNETLVLKKFYIVRQKYGKQLIETTAGEARNCHWQSHKNVAY